MSPLIGIGATVYRPSGAVSDPNLVTGDNRDFTTGLGDWINGQPSRGSVNWNATNETMEVVSDGAGGYPRATLEAVVQIGGTYTFSAELVSLTATPAAIYFASDAIGTVDSTVDNGSTPQILSVQFVVTQTPVYLAVMNNNGASDSRISEWDNMSLVLDIPP